MPKLTGFPTVTLPGPRPIPLLGPLPRLFRFMSDPIGVLEDLRRHGDVVAVSRDSPALVCVFGPERNREVLSNPGTFHHDEDFIVGPKGSSGDRMRQVIVAINGDVHKRHRRLMAPAFSKSALDGYAEATIELAEEGVERWPRDEVVDLDALLRDLVLHITVRVLFGIDVRHRDNDLGEVTVEWIDALTAPLSILLRRDLPGTPFRRALRLGDEVLAKLGRLVTEKRNCPEPGTDALARLLQATDDDGTGLSDAEVMPDVVTLFVAGHETTAKTLTWTMFLLDRHPDVLADLLDEIDGVLGGRSMSIDDIPRMPLLDRVLKESMRVLTAVPTLFFRVPASKTALGRFTLPPGSNVLVSPHATHLDPALYSEPRRFRPERWEGLRPTIYEYLPFGAGPRACVGSLFAQQSLRLILPTILQRTRAAVVRDARIDRAVSANILRPRYGLPARLEASHRRRLVPEPIRGNVCEMVALGQ